jgi:hypothetical protein
MAISTVNISSPANESIYNSTAMGNTVEGIKASSAKVLSIQVDNSANGGAVSYVKLFNVASGSVVLGTTAPDEILFVPGGAVITQPYFTGANPGKTFATALSAACVTAGGTAGVTAPASAVVVTVNFV